MSESFTQPTLLRDEKRTISYCDLQGKLDNIALSDDSCNSAVVLLGISQRPSAGVTADMRDFAKTVGSFL